jgi:putative alpha-1,2-mannosidase
VRSLLLDGHPYNKPWLPLEALAGGADLRATMSATPDTAWGSYPADAPPSFATGEAPARG